ncbi:layilin isoform X4 [Petaurus breviceps papuanus]|uniref:layilin isoform X4 n=1 Tax=Petaurus breviceps papuanus TaxID=3040969 RepID=UPI0036D8901E
MQPRSVQPGAALTALLTAVLAWPREGGSRLLSASDLDLRGGQPICRGGTQRPCYKVVYFHDASRRVSFDEASMACQRDGGQLVSVESEDEQRLIEKFIENLLASDGDFWIGLQRHEENQGNNSTACPDLYMWTDGSTSTFRNWYVDEPSCGSEVCVVMYHQPSAPVGIGGPYMSQWNDDRCNMKNNFICKYSEEKPILAATSVIWSHLPEGDKREPVTPTPPERFLKEDSNGTVRETKGSELNLAYILIPSIPLFLLLVVTTVICWLWICARRKREQTESTKEPNIWPAPHRRNSPDLEVYNVIRKQSEADLTEPRPDLKNISFRSRSGGATPNDLSCDYDNIVVNASESGFVTLASMESGFVANDIYELSPERIGRSKESGWVENEIYGY